MILEIQELDMKMIRLMNVKKQRRNELHNVQKELDDVVHKAAGKDEHIAATRKDLRILETQITDVNARIEKAEAKQNAIKKVEEFNAMTGEITSAQREKTRLESQASEVTDRLVAEEEGIQDLKKEVKRVQDTSKSLQKELTGAIEEINSEGVLLQKERASLAANADHDLLEIYERLLHNKKDRVLVAVENRTCSGCHIVLTAQHENLVRRGERPVFCEHCARLHYWKVEEEGPSGDVAVKRRRKK
ncbi:MAG: C4-type zinc ribbon domain-containing protein [Chlamydiota bacterium]